MLCPLSKIWAIIEEEPKEDLSDNTELNDDRKKVESLLADNSEVLEKEKEGNLFGSQFQEGVTKYLSTKKKRSQKSFLVFSQAGIKETVGPFVGPFATAEQKWCRQRAWRHIC